MAKKITPRTLKGFRDYLPETMIPRRNIIETAARIYQSYGFVPIDTPALEYLEILTGKGSDETDKQLYSFQDKGGRDLGMRFDLTVPLARFVSQHLSALEDVFDVKEEEGRLTLVPKTRELREFVKRATLEGADFPTRFTLDYVTGDRLEIDLVQSR